MDGLDCAHCASEVESAIASTDGFENVSLVFAKKLLYFEHQEDTDIVQTVQKITDSVEDGVTVSMLNNSSSKVKYKLVMDGLDCAHCASEVESAIASTDGFENVSLVFAKKLLYFEHQEDADIVQTVQKITDSVEDGVTVSMLEEKKEKEEVKNESFFKKNILLFIAIAFGISAFVCELVGVNEIVIAILSVIAIVLSGYKVFIQGVKSIFKLRLDESTLMSIAVIAAFCLGQFVEGAMVTILFGIGEMLEDKAVENSRKSIENLANIQPDTAILFENNIEKEVKAEIVKAGSVIIVKPHERIPLDGIVIEGKSSVDTSALTGESMPMDCEEGKELLSGMMNGDGLIKVKTTKEYGESTASRILQLVEEASITKSNNEKLITRFATIYTPIVVLISIAIAILPPLLGMGSFSMWIYRGLVCLVASCPCAIVISVPLSYYSGIGAASKMGVLFKGGKYLEALSKVDTMVFDKTGTLTKGELEIVNIIPYKNYTKDEILALAASCEKNSSHPIAEAIRGCYKGEDIELEDYKEKSGYGVSAVYNGKELLCGNKKLLKEDIDIDATVFLIYDGELIGAIEVSDTVREEAKSIISQLKNIGFKNLVMLTGDDKKPAQKVSQSLGLTDFHSNLLPEDKVRIVNELKESTKGVSFVGDGINDSPVITASDCGFAMGFGSDAAIQAADGVLTSGNLTALAKAVKIARKTVGTAKFNISFALIIKAIVIILAFFGVAAIWMSVIADTGVCLACVLIATKLLKTKF
jgi:Cd2+/Zn2+-exporting ATPase